jgi:hypothetical protein
MTAPMMDRAILEGRDFPSPVCRILALGYYDGPTEGLLQCEAGRVYRFELLAWDAETQDVRVFSLAPMPSVAFDLLAERYAHHEKPRWPIWVPSWYEDPKEETAAILAQAGEVEWVIATEDLMGTILAAKRVRPDDLRAVTDWRPFLGLALPRPVSSIDLRDA